jgi:hypothetical protein
MGSDVKVEVVKIDGKTFVMFDGILAVNAVQLREVVMRNFNRWKVTERRNNYDLLPPPARVVADIERIAAHRQKTGTTDTYPTKALRKKYGPEAVEKAMGKLNKSSEKLAWGQPKINKKAFLKP